MLIKHREAGNAFVFFEFEKDDRTASIITSTQKFLDYLNAKGQLKIKYDYAEKDDSGTLWLVQRKKEEEWQEVKICYHALQVLERVDEDATIKAVKYFDKQINEKRYENQIA